MMRTLAVIVLIFVAPGCGGSGAGLGSEDGYSPQDRAIQFTEEWYRWNDQTPPDDLTCTYSSADGGGAHWFYCGPDELPVFCSGETTNAPLTGKSDRRNGIWGDCGFD